MSDTILLKFAEKGEAALIIGVVLLVLAPMIFRLVDKLLTAMREEAAAERRAAREEAAAARQAYRDETTLERTAHREETRELAGAIRGVQEATLQQTLAVTGELQHQSALLERITDSGDLPRKEG